VERSAQGEGALPQAKRTGPYSKPTVSKAKETRHKVDLFFPAINGAKKIRVGWTPMPSPQRIPCSQVGTGRRTVKRRAAEKSAASAYTSAMIAWDQKRGANPKERPAIIAIKAEQEAWRIAAAVKPPARAPEKAESKFSRQAGSPQGNCRKIAPKSK